MANTIATLLTDREVAVLTGFTVTTVKKWRLSNRGPKYIKIGTSVRYKPRDVVAWLESFDTVGEERNEGAK